MSAALGAVGLTNVRTAEVERHRGDRGCRAHRGAVGPTNMSAALPRPSVTAGPPRGARPTNMSAALTAVGLTNTSAVSAVLPRSSVTAATTSPARRSSGRGRARPRRARRRARRSHGDAKVFDLAGLLERCEEREHRPRQCSPSSVPTAPQNRLDGLIEGRDITDSCDVLAVLT